MARKRGRIRQAIANRLNTFRTNRANRRAAKAARRAAKPNQSAPRTIVQVVRAAPQKARRVAKRGAAVATSAISNLRNRYVGRRAATGLDLKSIGKSFVMSGAGGVASALLTGVLTLDDSDPKNTFNDDNPIVQVALKGALGVGVQWMFGKSAGVKSFVDGWNGHSVGYAVAGYTDKAFKLAKDASDLRDKINGTSKK